MEEHFYHRKSLGQHFLKDSGALRIIYEEYRKRASAKALLEIGPGAGALTEYLSADPDISLWCIEKDERCVQLLKGRFPQLEDRIISGDFLEWDWQLPVGGQLDVIGNFPYNISSQIIFSILDHRERVPLALGMFQQEVAERIHSPAGNRSYGILSVLVQTYYRTELVLRIPPESFDPPPKVWSAVLVLERKAELPDVDYNGFRSFVKRAFSQRRKKLRNIFKNQVSPELLESEVFQKRAEALDPKEMLDLYYKVESDG